MKRDLRAIIFDADGTLLDTREFILQAFEHVIARHGYPIPDRVFMMAHMGQPLVDCYRAFAPSGDFESLRSMHRAFQETNLSLVDSYEGLVYTLDTLRDHGFKIAICTSRGPNVVTTLEHVGIKDHCDVIVHSDHVTKHKPDPEGILKAAAELGSEPRVAAMIGDTAVDIQAGKNAGVSCTVGVTHGFGTRETLQEAGADYIVDRLPDILPLFVDTK